MKANIVPILALAAAAGIATAASAELAQLDSAKFERCYEMFERPDGQDLDGGGKDDFTGWNATYFTLGTGADVGTIKIDALTNGKYLISNQEAGNAGDGWRALGPSSATGFTVEARVKVTACTGANGAICIEAGPSGSSVHARLSLHADKISWNGTTLKEMDTSAFHTYRIAREGGTAVHSVWVDGVLVAENLGKGFTISSILNRMLLGSPGSGWTGKAEVAWLRFTKGAYAPATPVAMRSGEFDAKYEMNDGDNSLVPVASGTTGAWKANVDARADVSKCDGRLSVSTGTYSVYWDTVDAVWKNLVDKDTAYTVEFKVKIDGTAHETADRALNVMTGSNGAVSDLFIGTNCVQWCLTTSGAGTFVTLDTSDNTDKMHTFRIAYDGGTRHGFTVWRDGVAIGENLVDCMNFYNFSGNALGIVRFGKSGGLNAGSYDLDYVRWKIGGVYLPVNENGTVFSVR